MAVDLDTPWALWEDSTAEFSLGRVEDPDYRPVFWLDDYPVVAGTRVEGVPNTADGLLGSATTGRTDHVLVVVLQGPTLTTWRSS